MRTAPSTRSAPSVFKPHAARRPCPSSARANSNTSAPECQPERPPTRPATRPRNKRRPLRNKARYRPRFGSQNQAISQIWHAKTDGFAQVRGFLRTSGDGSLQTLATRFHASPASQDCNDATVLAPPASLPYPTARQSYNTADKQSRNYRLYWADARNPWCRIWA